ncbi:efflux RND transporter permease subunit [Caulobacter segnis]
MKTRERQRRRRSTDQVDQGRSAGLAKTQGGVAFARIFGHGRRDPRQLRSHARHACWKAWCWPRWWCSCSCSEWRATLITAIAMPVSLVPTFAFMAIMGFSLNVVTLLALTLVIGILVDDAVVEIENIEKRVSPRASGPIQAAIEGGRRHRPGGRGHHLRHRGGVRAGVYMPGTPGQFFKEFGLTVAVAVLFSLVVARLLTPLLAAYSAQAPAKDPHEPPP